MRRRAEHLVSKRDGRREFLRTTKVARSIHLALHSVGVDEDWRALELANVALAALRQKQPAAADGEHVVLTTADIAGAVQHLLVVTGQPAAAVAYGAVAAERARRRQSLAALGRTSLLAGLSGTCSLATGAMGAGSGPDARARGLWRE